MFRNLTPFQARFLLFRALALIALCFAVFGSVQAIAQVLPAGGAPPDTSPTLVSFDPNGLMGTGMKLLETVLLALAALVAKRFDTFLALRAQTNKAFAVGQSLWTKIQAIANHVEVELKPQFDKDLEDGKLTADEAKALKSAALDIIKRDCADEIAQLPKLFGLNTDSAIGTFISGLLEQAVKLIGLSSPSLAKALAGGDASPATASPAASAAPAAAATSPT